MKNKKQLAINLISNSIAFIVGPGINFVLYPYIIKHIGVEAFGFVGLAINFVGYAQLVTIALNSMAGRFITIKIHENDFEAANRYVNSVFWANLVAGAFILACSGVCILYLEHIVKIPQGIVNDVKVLFVFSFLSFFINIMDSVSGVGTYAKNRLDISAARDLAANILRGAVLFALYYFFSPKVAYLGLATLLMNIFIISVNIFYLIRLIPEIHISRKYFDFGKMIEMMSVGIWNVFGKLAGIFSQGLDLLIANLFISATAMGVISASKTIPVIIMSILVMISNVFSPQLTISYAKRDFEDMNKQIRFSMKAIGMFISLPVAFILVYGDSFYRLWLPSQNAELLRWLTFVNMSGLIIGGSMYVFSNIYTALNKIKVPTIANFILSFSNILMVFTLLYFTKDDNSRLFTVIGVNAVTGIIASLTFSPIYAAKCLGMKWNHFYSEIGINLSSFIMISVILFILRRYVQINSWLMLFTVGAAVSFTGIIINYFFVFNKDERRNFAGLIKRKFMSKQNKEAGI